jgi:hypothetical protein
VQGVGRASIHQKWNGNTIAENQAQAICASNTLAPEFAEASYEHYHHQ